jgi:signal transduction histidine kinase
MNSGTTSLRLRLLVGTATATAAILLCAGVVIYLRVAAALRADFDLALETSVRAMCSLTEQDGKHVKLEPEATNMPEFTRKKRPDFFAAWLHNGEAFARSGSLGDRMLPHANPSVGGLVFETVTLPDGEPGRQATIKFFPIVEHPTEKALTRGPHPVTLTVARHTNDLRQMLARIAWLLGTVGVAATLAAAGAMLLVVGRGLRPLGTLAGRISTIGGRDGLGDRIRLDGAPRELVPVVLRLNELLDRLQTLVTRERRFTADVSHELRTPLAGLEAILDVCAARRRTTEEYERTLGQCARIVRSMHAMIDNLLTLARADAHQLTVTPSAVHVAPFIEECWEPMALSAKEKGAATVFQVDDGLQLQTDVDKLRIIVNNLLDNAVQHCDAGGWIRVQGRRAGPADQTVELTFSNSGSAVSAADAERAFDRFWRGDASRQGTGLHCGLGLSLCREIAGVLGGQIQVTSARGGVFEVRLQLPAPAPQVGQPSEAEARPVLAAQAGV